jgi:hypothetical protein
MFDLLTNRLIEAVTRTCETNLHELTEARRIELEEMRDKVRTEPHEVEKWFKTEIRKLGDIDIGEILGKLNNKK